MEKEGDNVDETIKRAGTKRRTITNPKLEFSKKLTIGASVFWSFLCVVSLASWFITGDWPKDIVLHFSLPFAGLFACYMGKSAYENKSKIHGGDGK